MTQKKPNELEAITQQLAALKEQAYKVDAETRTHIEKRDKLNEQFKKLRQEISEQKNTRDTLNAKVRTLKQQRDEARAKIGTIREEISVHIEKIKELRKKAPKVSNAELQEELKDIEWKIQTTSLDLQEEKRLVETVKQLETQLSVHKKIEKQDKKIAELREKLRPLEASADTEHKELTATAQKSQEIHANMLAKITESKTVKAQADSLHNAYILSREQAKPLHEEIKRLTERGRKLQEAIHEEDKKSKKSKEQALKETLGSQARDKLKRGEKLSWNEFQLLAEDDQKEQD